MSDGRSNKSPVAKVLRFEKYGLSPKIVRETIDSILRHASPDRIILYGSRSRGDFSDRSDIDLAVEGVAEPGLLRGYLEEEVQTLRKFDVLDLGRATTSIRESVERDGIILYEKGNPSFQEL